MRASLNSAALFPRCAFIFKCRWASLLRNISCELDRKASQAHVAARQPSSSVHSREKWGIWRKSSDQVQRLCRYHAKLAGRDLAALLGLAMVVVSLYRTLPLAKEVLRTGARSPLDRCARGNGGQTTTSLE